MSRKLAAQSRTRDHEHAAAHFEERARRTSEQAALICQVLADRLAETTW